MSFRKMTSTFQRFSVGAVTTALSAYAALLVAQASQII